jgi:hormone-sensitive lipase
MSKMVMSVVRGKYQKVEANAPPKAVIFHIHGGGFISMSSFIHQSYTRTWANELEVPIVSVDYGKAPEHPFPDGLEDCLEAYLWTLYCMRQLYEFEPHRIILVGDSAGGNLVASLLNILISWNLRQPDGIVLVYPALNLHYFDYTPSLLTSLNDMILPHTFLKICLDSYLKDPRFKPEEDFLISPILTPDNLLKQYPLTKIFVGSKDPFHDDCCRLTERLALVLAYLVPSTLGRCISPFSKSSLTASFSST